jgi:hypothetical protein
LPYLLALGNDQNTFPWFKSRILKKKNWKITFFSNSRHRCYKCSVFCDIRVIFWSFCRTHPKIRRAAKYFPTLKYVFWEKKVSKNIFLHVILGLGGLWAYT